MVVIHLLLPFLVRFSILARLNERIRLLYLMVHMGITNHVVYYVMDIT